MQETPGNHLAVYINPFRTTLVLGTVVIGLAAAHALVHLLRYLFGLSHGEEEMFGLLRLFDMGSEANLPTYVSALNLLFAGGLGALIARYESRCQRKQNWHWWGLAIGFRLMSVDEAAMIHDGLVGAFMTSYFGYTARVSCIPDGTCRIFPLCSLLASCTCHSSFDCHCDTH